MIGKTLQKRWESFSQNYADNGYAFVRSRFDRKDIARTMEGVLMIMKGR